MGRDDLPGPRNHDRHAATADPQRDLRALADVDLATEGGFPGS